VAGRWLHRQDFFPARCTKLHQDQLLDLTVIHGDGTTTAAKKGGDNLGYSGHKHLKGDKVVAFCDRRCNVIAPFVSAPGNRNESPLLRDALPGLSRMARAIGMDLQGTFMMSGRRLRLPGQLQGDFQPEPRFGVLRPRGFSGMLGIMHRGNAVRQAGR